MNATLLALPTAPAKPSQGPPDLRLCELTLVEALFDSLPDVVFFVKDSGGRYLVVNNTLVRRGAVSGKRALLGRTTREVFPGTMGEGFLAQDRAVIVSGVAMQRHLELHRYANGCAGWCLTHKLPLRNECGAIVGVAGISRDLGLPDQGHPVYGRIAQIAQHIRARYEEPLCLGQLASQAEVSLDRVERLFQRIFGITPREMLLQARLDAARGLLESAPQLSVAAIAASCGYSDHSAFARQFKSTIGMTPSQYRQLQAQTEPRYGALSA